MKNMRLEKSALVLSLFLARPLWAIDALIIPSTSAAGACQDAGGCPATVFPSTPTWKQDLQKAQTSEDACRADIDKFCEGVQVGKRRLKKCLKAHRSKLSPKCRT